MTVIRRFDQDPVPVDTLYFPVYVFDPAPTVNPVMYDASLDAFAVDDVGRNANESVAANVYEPEMSMPIDELALTVLFEISADTAMMVRGPVVTVTEGPTVARSVNDVDVSVSGDAPTKAYPI